MSVKGNPDLGKKIENMDIGEIGYALTNSLAFDKGGTPYLNLTKTVFGEKHGAFKMPIERMGPEKSDYEVDTDFASYETKWERKENPHRNTDESDIVELELDNEIPSIIKQIKEMGVSEVLDEIKVGNTDITISHN